jgi:hypothetical protein
VRLRSMLLWVVAIGVLSRPLAGFDEVFVKRGEPQREGRVWVERAECGAPVREGARLVLRADFGTVRVTSGRSDRVECHVRLRVFKPSAEEASRYFRSVELTARRLEGGGLYLSARSTRDHERHEWSAAEFELVVPQRFNLDLETKGGDVSVSGLDGELRAATAGGNVQTGDVTGPVRIETAGGDIDLGDIGQRLSAQTAGGGIRVGNIKGDATLETSGGVISAGMIDGSVRADTSGGDIVLRGASGPVTAETAGGQIQIGQCGASIRAETAGGSIRLQGARGVVVETAGGSIDLFHMLGAVRAVNSAGRILAEFEANHNGFDASHLETSVGDVQVFLPADLGLNIDALIEESMGHRIVSDFPLHLFAEDEEEVDHGPKHGEGAVNGGGKVLRIRTVMGNIEIHKIDTRMLEQIKQRQEIFWKRWEEEQKAHKLKCQESASKPD